jgi:hypothetical protein
MKITLNEFKGIQPKIANDKLPINMAQVASDVKTASKELMAYRRNTSDISLAGSSYKSLFEYLEGGNNHWVYYDLVVHWVRTPVAEDTFERMYMTGADGSGKYKAFVNDLITGTFDFTTDFYYPGAPSAVAMSATGYTTGANYRAYFYTYVSRYGEEGPPSALTEITDYDGSSNVTLGNFTEPSASDEHLKTQVGTKKPAIRIYRTSATGTGAAEFLLVAEIDTSAITWSTYTYVDSKADSALGETCDSIFYDRAPDNLTNLRGHPNGFFVASKGNVLYFSEPYQPHAWPEDYRISIDQEIVAVGIFGSTVVAATDGFIYTFSGPHPNSMYKKKESFQPCLSQRALVETDDGVMFPSLEGFQLVSSKGVDNVTRETFKPEDWVDYYLDQMHSTWYNKGYYGFYKSGNDFQGYIKIDFLNDSITTGVSYHWAGHVALLDGTFRTINASDFTDPTQLYISRWDADPIEYRPYSYRTPLFISTKPVNFKVAQVILNQDFINEVAEQISESTRLQVANAAAWAAGDFRSMMNGFMLNEQDVNGDTLYSLRDLGVWNYVDFKVIVDGTVKFVKQVTNNEMFKLPKGFKNKKWTFELEGMIPVKRVTVATSTEEIV